MLLLAKLCILGSLKMAPWRWNLWELYMLGTIYSCFMWICWILLLFVRIIYNIIEWIYTVKFYTAYSSATPKYSSISYGIFHCYYLYWLLFHFRHCINSYSNWIGDKFCDYSSNMLYILSSRWTFQKSISYWSSLNHILIFWGASSPLVVE